MNMKRPRSRPMFSGYAPMSLGTAAAPIRTDERGIAAALRRIPVKDGALPA